MHAASLLLWWVSPVSLLILMNLATCNPMHTHKNSQCSGEISENQMFVMVGRSLTSALSLREAMWGSALCHNANR